VSTCRSCGAEVIWAVTRDDKRMPLDAVPVDGGNVLLNMGARPWRATVVGKDVQPSIFGDDSPRYTSHFSTCPHADSHRKAH
jgi:hypothetical protein